MGTRMPNDWVLQRGLVRGTLVFGPHGGVVTAQLLGGDGREIYDPLLGARRYERADGVVKFTGMQFYGSKSPKSKRWGRAWQEWLCRPVQA